MQCHECEGYGHFVRECPTVKRREGKCSSCKGMGHSEDECDSYLKNLTEKSMLGIEDESADDSEEEEEILNFVALVGITEFVDGVEVTGFRFRRRTRC